jgi:hypothetical protein
MVSFSAFAAMLVPFLGVVVEAQTTSGVGGVATSTSISAYGQMMAIGDKTIFTAYVDADAPGAQAEGHVGINYYDFRTGAWTGREDILLNPYVLDTGSPSKVLYGDPYTTVNANNGFGHDVSCANDDTVFISACNQEYNSGRVYLYKGRNAHWTAQQILNSYRTNPFEYFSTSGDTYFGEALASSESVLAVGCRNCNSTLQAHAQSGEIYIFRPEKDKTSVLWTNTQILTAKDAYFMGGHVAMHEGVVVASGNSKEDFTLNTILTTPIQASIFVAEDPLATHGPKSEFKHRQNVFLRDPLYQRIADVAVYDMTIAMATYDSVGDSSTLYIFYPNTKQYNLESKDPKGKPRALSWSLVQVLTTPTTVFIANNPTYLSLWDNKLFMRGTNGPVSSGRPTRLYSTRPSRAAAYPAFDTYATVDSNYQPSVNYMLTTSDHNL